MPIPEDIFCLRNSHSGTQIVLWNRHSKVYKICLWNRYSVKHYEHSILHDPELINMFSEHPFQKHILCSSKHLFWKIICVSEWLFHEKKWLMKYLFHIYFLLFLFQNGWFIKQKKKLQKKGRKCICTWTHESCVVATSIKMARILRLLLPPSWKRITTYSREMERKLVELNACGCGTLVEFNVRVEWFLKKEGVKGWGRRCYLIEGSVVISINNGGARYKYERAGFKSF